MARCGTYILGGVMRARSILTLAAILFLVSMRAGAQTQGGTNGTGSASQSDGFFADWFRMVAATQAEQPHWVTPVATTTPRLEQEFRYDIFWQTGNTGITTENYGGAKGVELIPARNVEVILVAPPAYIVHNNPAVKDGF